MLLPIASLGGYYKGGDTLKCLHCEEGVTGNQKTSWFCGQCTFYRFTGKVVPVHRQETTDHSGKGATGRCRHNCLKAHIAYVEAESWKEGGKKPFKMI